MTANEIATYWALTMATLADKLLEVDQSPGSHELAVLMRGSAFHIGEVFRVAVENNLSPLTCTSLFKTIASRLPQGDQPQLVIELNPDTIH